MIDAVPASVPLSERIMVRFGTTLVTNLVRGGLSLVSGILIARGLGASGYGDLYFLLGSFAAISQLLDMGTSFAFFTFISARRRSRTFVALYLGWIAFQFVVTVLAVALLLPGSLIERIWVGHELGIVLLAFGASFLVTQAWGVVSQLGEATRKTVMVQAAAVAQAVVHLALVVAAVHWDWLTVQTVMWLLVGEYTLLAVVFGPKLIRENLSDEPDRGDGPGTVVREFVAYCKPLVVYGWVNFLYTFANRWLLQEFGGSEQQGFFAVSQQFANIGLIATASILKVFWKEIAEAREREDEERIRRLYVQVTRGSYFGAAFVSCFIVPYSKEIVEFFLGIAYLGAWPCLAVMLLYPVQQALGQTQGVFFYASRATGMTTKIGISMMLLNIPITYLVLAPPTAPIPGLQLGAIGLAVQLVVMGIVGLNLQAFMISRANGWTFEYVYQMLVLVPLLTLSFLLKWVISSGFHFFLVPASSALIPIGALPLYVLSGLAILLLKPELGGMTREDIRMLRSRLLRWRSWLPASIGESGMAILYTSPLRFEMIAKEFVKVLIQPIRDAYVYRNFKLFEASLNYVKTFRDYSKNKLREWGDRGLLNMRPCPLCASHRFEPRLQTPDDVHYVSCSNCEFVFMNPAPSHSTYNAMYESGYDGLLTAWEKTKDENAMCDYRFEKYFGLDLIRRHQRGGKFLDYGCGSGWVLRLAQRDYDVTGMDIDPNQLARIRSLLNIDSVIEGDITQGLPLSLYGVFDVIHSNQNLEHMLEPRKCVAEWSRCLKPGGFLFVACPNFDSFAFDVYGGQNSMAVLTHVSLFSLQTIQYLLESEGFEVIERGSYARDITVYEYWQHKMNPSPHLFEHRHAYLTSPKTVIALGSPLWIMTELYFYYEMVRRKEKFGNYLYCLARKK